MLEKVKFYKGTIDINLLKSKYFDESKPLNSVKEDIIESLLKINNSDDQPKILIYQPTDATVSFFIKVKESQKEDHNRLKITFREGEIKEFVLATSDYKLSDSSIEPILLDQIDPVICYEKAKDALNTFDGIFTDEDFVRFFDAFDENDNLDTILGDQDIQEIFSGIFDNIVEQTANENQVDILGLSSLIGLDNFKKEMCKISNYSKASSSLCNTSKERLFPIHYVFTINPGMGITTILEAFAKKIYRFGLVESDRVLEYKGSMLFDSKSKHNEDTSLFKMNHKGEYSFDNEYSVIAFNILTYIDEPQFDMNKLVNILKYARGETIFVLIMNKENHKRNLRIMDIFKQKLNIRHIDFSDYTEAELVEIGNQLLHKYGFELDNEAENYLIERIKEERYRGTFYNVRTVQRIIEEVRIRKLFDLDGENSGKMNELNMEDFKHIINEKQMAALDAWKELDELVGLNEVKDRVKEIISFAKVQKHLEELGVETKKNSYHMMFTGNPGTGKTTIARILGKLFKEIGVLSIGDTIEVSRDGLVSIYVGNTAPMVRDKVRQAMGSVLFIDEAYSLYEEDGRHNYGKEAIDTLVKLMEDNREDFIVIMAGYKDKMQKLLSVNQGLKERISYKIDFPDYTGDELTKIFTQILGDAYIFEEGAYEKINELMKLACKNKGESFANGRLARNVAERLKIKQSVRICNEGLYDRQNMLSIKMQDVEALYQDPDIKSSIYNSENNKKKMGFLQDKE